MGGYLQVSTPLTYSPPPSLSSPPPPKPNLPMLYYGLVVVATAAVVLAFYNLIIVRWRTIQYQRRLQQENQLSRRRRNPSATMSPPLSRGGSGVCLLSSFKYKKGEEGNKTQLDFESECSVCISVFEEGEEVRKLPMCDHCFHAHCIDMWLYSHIDCPLCRTPVVEPPPPPPPG